VQINVTNLNTNGFQSWTNPHGTLLTPPSLPPTSYCFRFWKCNSEWLWHLHWMPATAQMWDVHPDLTLYHTRSSQLSMIHGTLAYYLHGGTHKKLFYHAIMSAGFKSARSTRYFLHWNAVICIDHNFYSGSDPGIRSLMFAPRSLANSR
jgi:hypothetical protein